MKCSNELFIFKHSRSRIQGQKNWIRELCVQHKVNFLSIQETKVANFSDMEVKLLWGNYCFEHVASKAIGCLGGILCIWDPNLFVKDQHIISDYFVLLYGTWIPSKTKICIVSIYAPQALSEKLFNSQGAAAFNNFISNSGLIDILLEGYSFTLAHPLGNKMSKLDRFLVSDGFVSLFPHTSDLCLDKHLFDHRLILLRELILDFGATPFWLSHSWFHWDGFDQMVVHSWNSYSLDDSNLMVRFKKKLQLLKKDIHSWVTTYKRTQLGRTSCLKDQLRDIDHIIDSGGCSDDILQFRKDLMNQLHELKESEAREFVQKAKVRWAIEGDENSKFFHGVINRKRVSLAVRGVMVDGDWVDDPGCIKEEFRSHFAKCFQPPNGYRNRLDFEFPKTLSSEQASDLEIPISKEEIRKAVWACGENKSPGPDGFTFEFVRSNSSFIALISKYRDPKSVNDYRPICLIGSLYKVVTKILAMRLSLVISELISDVQTAFVAVDFAKACDSVRWDYLDDVLRSFGFGSKWCSWIKGSLSSSMASILVNGCLTSELQFYCGLKQGDPLAPYLFILVMESLHLSFSRVVDAGIFKGIKIDNSVTISHLFYADDAVFVGEWSQENLDKILNVLHCFHLASGLRINVKKSHLLGVGVPHGTVQIAAVNLGCSIMKTPFKYLGVMVGGNSLKSEFWGDIMSKLNSRMSKWKSKTLSIGGRLTLLKSVLGATPIYNMSLFKVPKTVLNRMESIRRDFFMVALVRLKKS
nr:RNA-directed DNA polymerase, eukaryota [Tanacetum cinerariifolium]